MKGNFLVHNHRERSPDEHSEIRGGAGVVPDVAPLIRVTSLGVGRRMEKCRDMAQHEVNPLLRSAAH